MRFEGVRFLVTGGAGYVGRNLGKHLVRLGAHSVRLMDLSDPTIKVSGGEGGERLARAR